METPQSEDDFVEPPSLRFLRRLVTVLTAVMIAGVVILVGLLVIHSPQTGELPMPQDITLPSGTQAQAITITEDFYLVVTQDQTVLVIDRTTGAVQHTITLTDILD